MASLEEIEKYICVICQELLLEPVVLPCNHTACLYCLEQTLDNNKYQCFLCRKSIQSWYRKTKKKECLVSTGLKDEIDNKFTDLMKKRRNGESLDLIPAIAPQVFSDPGEIKRDFESELAQIRTEIQKEKEKENKLSEELIRQIKNEEEKIKRAAEEELKKDEELARQLEIELSSSTSEEEEKIKRAAEEKLKKDEELARQLEIELNSSTSTVQNDTMMSDEKLARELARDLEVSEFPLKVDVLPKNINSAEDRHGDLKKSQNEGFTHPMQSPGPSKSDEGWTRKSDCYKSPSAMKSKVSPGIKQQPLKKQPTAKYGPMDRFLGFGFKHEEPRRK